MTVTELALPRGAGRLEVVQNPLLVKAADILLPPATLFVPERRLHLVTAEETIAFSHPESSDLSDEVKAELQDPEFITGIFPMMAKNWWRFVHGVGVAEMLVEANRGDNSILQQAGFDMPKERERQFVRAAIAHDLGMAFTRRSDIELNPVDRSYLRGCGKPWHDMKRHPVLSTKKLRREFSALELDLMGEHQSRGKVRETYGWNPYKEVTDPSDHADENEHILFAIMDILQATTATTRKYHRIRAAGEAKQIVHNEFRGHELGIEDYLAELAEKRRNFDLVATPEMEAFNDSLRGEDKGRWSGRNQRYWAHPHALVGVFSSGVRK